MTMANLHFQTYPLYFREDDNDKSDDEDERIEFSTNTEAVERQRMKDNFLAAEHGTQPCLSFVNICVLPVLEINLFSWN